MTTIKSKTKTYKTWTSMKQRCTNKTSTGYKYYGARGISVCQRWMESFENFLADMGEHPPGKTIDRIDNNGNYEPGNCQWSTTIEQARNKSTNRLVTIGESTMAAAAWADYPGATVRAKTIRNRLDAGSQPIDAVFGEPKTGGRGKVGRALTIYGKTQTVQAWSQISGIKRTTIYQRLHYGWSHKESVFGRAA